MTNFQLNFVTDKSKVRWLKILDCFEKTPEVTSQFLADAIQNSQRTVLTELPRLKEYFQETITIESTGKGYRYTCLSHNDYLKQKRMLLKNEPLSIVLASIFYNKLQTASEWADTFYLSEKTMISYLTNIQKEIQKFDLSLSLTPVTITGKEVNIRYFFYLLYYESEVTPHTISPSKAAKEVAQELITRFVRTNRHFPSDFFTYITFIAMERAKNNFFITVEPPLKSILTSFSFYRRFESIDQKIVADYFDPTVIEEECLYLYAAILAVRTIEDPEIEHAFFCKYNQWPELTSLARTFHEAYLTDSTNKDQDLIFLRSFFLSLKMKELLSKQLLLNTGNTNHLINELFLHEFSSYHNFLLENPDYQAVFPVSIVEDLCAKLILHTKTFQETYWRKEKKRIAFVFEGDLFLIQYMKGWVARMVGDTHDVFFPLEKQLTPEYMKENKISIVVSNAKEFLFTDPTMQVVLMNSFPSTSDWKQLSELLDLPTL